MTRTAARAALWLVKGGGVGAVLIATRLAEPGVPAPTNLAPIPKKNRRRSVSMRRGDRRPASNEDREAG
jgi:hypothetical protein